jgi:transcriptional regulator with XRE-family HTH domain
VQKDYEEILEDFRKNLQNLRKKQGLSQELVAGLDLSVRNYQKIESGGSIPSLKTLLIIADGLGIHPRELLEIPSLKFRPIQEEVKIKKKTNMKKNTAKKKI